MYNYSGNGLKLGAAGNNPMIEVVTTSGSESVNLHKQLELKDYGSGTYTGTYGNWANTFSAQSIR